MIVYLSPELFGKLFKPVRTRIIKLGLQENMENTMGANENDA